MRPISRVLLAVLTGLVVLWLTAPDLIARVVPGLPRNTLQISITSQEQRLHFSHSATGTAWLIWFTLVIVGWRMKRWGRAMLGVGVPIGLIGSLPLLPILRLGAASAVRSVRRCDWLDLALVTAVLLVITCKSAIWFYWWRLVRFARASEVNSFAKRS